MSKIKIKVTNTMFRLIKKALPQYKVELVKLTEEEFKWCVDLDVWGNEVDYCYKDNTFKVIRIIYPPEWYACDKYLTTKDLEYNFKQSDKTLKGFIDEVVGFCGI